VPDEQGYLLSKAAGISDLAKEKRINVVSKSTLFETTFTTTLLYHKID
jgi:hypothetical protein